eukprot:CAMPEP_0177611008 /NCGR_PEP_ID=MMETSP0419_2-20121207/20184_1 /TAXON_ID=582737 /ORGANISM="Tetraselmis sp., Strain GSL018" /LENGTH=285 /DNA_ID=CAMNT_0019106553 /DNA_START=291 /DNA_END=1149 /DNA_ORIENTATION=-
MPALRGPAGRQAAALCGRRSRPGRAARAPPIPRQTGGRLTSQRRSAPNPTPPTRTWIPQALDPRRGENRAGPLPEPALPVAVVTPSPHPPCSIQRQEVPPAAGDGGPTAAVRPQGRRINLLGLVRVAPVRRGTAPKQEEASVGVDQRRGLPPCRNLYRPLLAGEAPDELGLPGNPQGFLPGLGAGGFPQLRGGCRAASWRRAREPELAFAVGPKGKNVVTTPVGSSVRNSRDNGVPEASGDIRSCIALESAANACRRRTCARGGGEPGSKLAKATLPGCQQCSVL